MRNKLRFISVATLMAAFGANGPAVACGTEAYIGQICIMATQFCPTNTAESSGQLLTIGQYQALYSLIGCTFGGDCRNNFALPDLRGRAPVGYGQGIGLANHNFGTSFGNEATVMTLSQLPTHNHTATFTPGGGGGSAVASGNVNIPVSGTVSGISVNSNVSGLTATTGGKVTIAANSPGAQTPTDGSILGKPGSASAGVYASGTPNLTIGGNQSFSGPVSGTITNTVTGGTVSGSATGSVSLPVTGGTGGGVVTVNTNGGSQPMATVPPEVAMRYCIVVNGLYPSRP